MNKCLPTACLISYFSPSLNHLRSTAPRSLAGRAMRKMPPSSVPLSSNSLRKLIASRKPIAPRSIRLLLHDLSKPQDFPGKALSRFPLAPDVPMALVSSPPTPHVPPLEPEVPPPCPNEDAGIH
ncbi:hypothetical protein NL676_021918 [Syzygium grande]|nr:hypothetical protein NL676_021918 [Syzygium grande]